MVVKRERKIEREREPASQISDLVLKAGERSRSRSRSSSRSSSSSSSSSKSLARAAGVGVGESDEMIVGLVNSKGRSISKSRRRRSKQGNREKKNKRWK